MSRDLMELVGRAEHFDGAHKRGCEGRSWTCTCGDDETAMNLIAQMAACIREMVERQLPEISKDGPNEIGRHGRFWLARQLLDSKLTAEEAYGIVAHHPSIQDALPPAPGAEDA